MSRFIIYFLSLFGFLFADQKAAVKDEVTMLIKAELSQKLIGQDFDISLDYWTDAWGDEKEKTLAAKDLELLQSNSRFQLDVQGFKDNKIKKISGKIIYKMAIPVLKRPLQIGEEIDEDDIVLQAVSLDDISHSYLTKKEQLVGLMPKNMALKPNTPLLKGQLQAPVVIKKGAIIRVSFEKKSLKITNKGVALKDGSKQDIIPIEITTHDPKQPKKVVEAFVVSSQDVKIQL
ncbi:MAG: flagellar basal body P-ring formation protein FlgA [Proteobacteria bacterium]|nr:flagellar basal body P-ring formation protein FlgA [Pseudomonadota bacterium]